MLLESLDEALLILGAKLDTLKTVSPTVSAESGSQFHLTGVQSQVGF